MDAVYLDHAATTPLRAEVRAAMEPHFGEVFGNPSSTHRFGRRARGALEDAREKVAGCLGAEPSEILFVRGGTESDNLAVLGRAAVAREAGRPPVVVHSAVEHSAVVDACLEVAAAGGRRIELPVDPEHGIDGDALGGCLSAHPDVVSVMWVNNETGTVLPVRELATRAREAGVAVHTDAVQAVGKVPVRVDETPVDLLTATGHKIHGPRGTGILFVRKGTELRPLLRGGGQERGMRPGTEDVAGAVGMAEALALAYEERSALAPRIAGLRDRLEALLLDGVEGARTYGGPDRACHILSVGIPGVDQDLLLAGLDLAGVACSAGSACHSGATGGAASSRVLRALHGDGTRGFAALRFSLGLGTRAQDVTRAAEATRAVVDRLRGGAPAPAGAEAGRGPEGPA